MCRNSAEIEKAGIPTVSIVGSHFTSVCNMACVGMGLGELPMAVVPQQVLSGEIQDFKPAIAAAMDDIIHGLTKWETKTRIQVREVQPRLFTVQGDGYQEAVDKMYDLFLENNWGDGLPLVPPTEERVEWLVSGTDISRDDVVGTVGPMKGLASVEVIAVNAAMAGARPEYMPLIIAAVKSITSPQFELDSLQATTNPVAPLIVVNGPIAKDVGINSSYGLFSPTTQLPASGVIGRALRLIMTNVGGAVAGVTDMATHGQPGKYTGLVIAEAEDLTPWDTLNVEMGYRRDSNTVTAIGVMGTTNYCCLSDVSYVENYLEGMTKFISVPSANYFYPVTVCGGVAKNICSGVLVIPPMAAKALAEKGWSKEKVRSFLFEKARIRVEDYLSYVSLPAHQEGLLPKGVKGMPPETLLPIAQGPSSFVVVVSGGKEPYHWQWLPVGHGGKICVTTEIELPTGWSRLNHQRSISGKT